MSKQSTVQSFRQQMADSMNELRSIMSSGQSPTADGRLTVRTIEIAEPSDYDARKVKKVRAALNVSQAVFARLIGVSDVLVRSWERGARRPAPIARRLLDQIQAYPGQFTPLVHPPQTAAENASRTSPKQRTPKAGKRNGKQAA